VKRIFSTSDYRIVPWKNGGGTTRELVVEHSGTPDRFLYRASIADVNESGPFSKFEGYDRHILLVEGAGMTLRHTGGTLELVERFVPVTFDGDWTVHGELRAGAVKDFNWIVDRARATSRLEARHVDGPHRVDVNPGEIAVVHVRAGALDGVEEQGTLVTDESVDLVAHGATLVLGFAAVHRDTVRM
jgi:uncharacterized protein